MASQEFWKTQSTFPGNKMYLVKPLGFKPPSLKMKANQDGQYWACVCQEQHLLGLGKGGCSSGREITAESHWPTQPWQRAEDSPPLWTQPHCVLSLHSARNLEAQGISSLGLFSFSKLKQELDPQLKRYLISRSILVSLYSSPQLQTNYYSINNGKTSIKIIQVLYKFKARFL